MKHLLNFLLIFVIIFSMTQCKSPKSGDTTTKKLSKEVLKKEEAVTKAPETKSNPEAEQKALESSAKWLKIVDAGDYGKSWDEFSKTYQSKVTKEQMNTSLSTVLKPLGKLLKREVISKKYMTALPALPDGEYVLIRYSSSFEKKKMAIETILSVLDADKVWRVGTYLIK